ncbi:Spc105 protein [Saccharomycopsis crataegensis]|uniref:Spc105 protein n=1 Tax=Saccharomycopsis crataegensis TaxID=43959 RepID=A0AAV5QJY7_9ASCO|nr:Spc105 protein [Saccharomycopsis crataegensis]
MSLFEKDHEVSKTKRRHTIGYKGILKEISSNNNEPPSKKIKRRVSFAPEVTLHKISIVPQFASRSSSISSVSDSENKQKPEEKENLHSDDPTDDDNGEIQQNPPSNELLTKNYNNGNDADAPQVNHDDDPGGKFADSDNINLGEIFDPLKYNGAKRSSKPSDDNQNDKNEKNKENCNDEPRFQKIELAVQTSPKDSKKEAQDSSANDEEMSMEFTESFKKVSNPILRTFDYPGEDDDVSVADEEMTKEVTMEITKVFKVHGVQNHTNSVPSHEKEKREEENKAEAEMDGEEEQELTEEITMELTKTIRFPKTSGASLIQKPKIQSQQQTFNQNENRNTQYDEDVSKEVTMEITSALKAPNPSKEGFSSETQNNLYDDNIEDDFEDEQTMDMTKPLSKIKPISLNPIDSNFQQSKETARNNEEKGEESNKTVEEEITMNFTKPVSSVLVPSTVTEKPVDEKLSEETCSEEKHIEEKPVENEEYKASGEDAIQTAEDVIIEQNKGDENISNESIHNIEEENKLSTAPNAEKDNGNDSQNEASKEDSDSKELSISEADKTMAFGSPERNPIGNQEGIEILNDEVHEAMFDENEQEDEDSDIYPDEKTMSNTIANSMLCKSAAPITSSPIKNVHDDQGELPVVAVQFHNEVLGSPVNFGLKASYGSPKRQKDIVEKAAERTLPPPSHLSGSPLRKALSRQSSMMNEDGSPLRNSIPKLPALNFKDQEILKSLPKLKRKRLSLPELPSSENKSVKRVKLNNNKKHSSKRQTISFGTKDLKNIDTINEEEENSSRMDLGDSFIEAASRAPVDGWDKDQSEIVADLSHESQDDYEPISVEQFLQEINVKFFDDMNHATILSTSLLPKNEKCDQAPGQLEYGRSNEQLSKLELLTYGCKELKKYIKEGQEFFSDLSKEISEVNPSTMKEFFNSTKEVKSSMIEQFHVSKTYAKLEARSDWYNWKSQLIDDIIVVMEKRLKDLEKQDKVLTERKNEYLGLYSKLNQKLADIEKKFYQMNFQNSFIKKNNSAKDELLALRKELVETTDQSWEIQRNLEELQNLSEYLSKEIEVKMREIEKMRLLIKNNEKEYVLSKSLESKEVSKALKIVESLIRRNGVKLVDIDQENGLITLRLLVNNLEEYSIVDNIEPEKDNSIDVTFSYQNLKSLDSFKFAIGKNFKFNESIYESNIKVCQPLNKMLKDYFDFNFSKLVSQGSDSFSNVFDLLSFFRKAVGIFKSTFAQLYYFTIKFRAKFEIVDQGAENNKKLLVDMKIWVKSQMSRRTVKMELSGDFMQDLFKVEDVGA